MSNIKGQPIFNTFKVTPHGKAGSLRLVPETGIFSGNDVVIEKIKPGKIIVTEKNIYDEDNKPFDNS
jgi:hypothetical protein